MPFLRLPSKTLVGFFKKLVPISFYYMSSFDYDNYDGKKAKDLADPRVF